MRRAGFASLLTLALLVSGCGGGHSRSQKELSVCHSIHENPVLFDEVLIAHHPAIDYPERTLTPVRLVTSKLGQPDEKLPISNVLFAWWRYGNTAYLIATLAADRPGHEYIAAVSCDWKLTQRRAKALLKNVGR